jgi:hypothetical protein
LIGSNYGSVSVNHIVDRIARETELVIDEFMPYASSPFRLDDLEDAPFNRRGRDRAQPAIGHCAKNRNKQFP